MDRNTLLEIGSFRNTRILYSAVDLELFKYLDKPATAADIAGEIGLNAEYVTRLLNALVALDILVKKREYYEIPGNLKEPLGYGTRSIIPMLRHRDNLSYNWRSLPDIVRAGKGYYELTGDERRSGDAFTAFIRAMATSGNEIAAESAAMLASPDVKKVLDIGGGPAIYAIEFCAAMPQADVFILDRPGVEEIASDYLIEAGLKDKVKFITGDALTIETKDMIEDDSEKFDLIFTSNVIHAFSYDETRRFLDQCARWVVPGGRIAVKEFYLNDDRITPPHAALFDINMLVNTTGGRVYTWSEIEKMMYALQDVDGEPLTENVSRIKLSDDSSGIVIAHVK